MTATFPRCGHVKSAKNTQPITVKAFSKKLGRVKEYHYEVCRMCKAAGVKSARPDLHPRKVAA